VPLNLSLNRHKSPPLFPAFGPPLFRALVRWCITALSCRFDHRSPPAVVVPVVWTSRDSGRSPPTSLVLHGRNQRRHAFQTPSVPWPSLSTLLAAPLRPILPSEPRSLVKAHPPFLAALLPSGLKEPAASSFPPPYRSSLVLP